MIPRPGVSDGDITGPNGRGLVFPDGDITGPNGRGLAFTEGDIMSDIYASTDSLHVLDLIGSDYTAFGIDCTAYLCNVSSDMYEYDTVHV